MNTSQQPEAIRLADKYEAHGFLGDHRFAKDHWCRQAAAELRRQHARIEELESQLAAAQQPPETTPVELQEPVGWFHRHPNECKNGELCNYQIASGDRKNGWEESPLYTEQQVHALLIGVPTPAAYADTKDAARYRWLRDNDWRNDEKMEPVIRLQLNAIWDEKIDAAMAAQARKEKGTKQ